MPKVAKTLPVYLSENEISKLLEGPNLLLENDSISPFEASRDKLLMEVIYAGGFRVSELVSINYGSIAEEQCMIRVLGKGKKERDCPIGRRAMKLLNDFKANFARFCNFDDPVFIDEKHQRLKVRKV